MHRLPTSQQAYARDLIARKPPSPRNFEIYILTGVQEIWGFYCATGDPFTLSRCIETLTLAKKPDYIRHEIGLEAEAFLVSVASRQAPVLEALRRARKTRPDLQPQLDEVINKARRGPVKMSLEDLGED